MAGERNTTGKVSGALNVTTNQLRSFAGAITPSDTTVYDPPLRGLRCGGAGNVVLTYVDDDETVTGNRDTVAVTAGQVLDQWAIRQVRATGTTATTITGYR